MEKFKPFYQMIPVLADAISTSLNPYIPDGGYQEEDDDDEGDEILD